MIIFHEKANRCFSDNADGHRTRATKKRMNTFELIVTSSILFQSGYRNDVFKEKNNHTTLLNLYNHLNVRILFFVFIYIQQNH